MREILMEDELATSALLRGDGVSTIATADFAWITTATQMGMGFILPFALVFVAIPLETFVSSTRTVIGIIALNVTKLRSDNVDPREYMDRPGRMATPR